MKSHIGVGIAGLGRSGWGMHVPTMKLLQDKYRIQAVFDLKEERLSEAKDSLGCKVYSDFDSFLENETVELVIIATPSHLHAPQTIKALKAEKKVVCEKPMASNLKEANTMVETSYKTTEDLTQITSKLKRLSTLES
jgi:predicted dehydrogenase